MVVGKEFVCLYSFFKRLLREEGGFRLFVLIFGLQFEDFSEIRVVSRSLTDIDTLNLPNSEIHVHFVMKSW